MIVVRLWERVVATDDQVEVTISVLERSTTELGRVAFLAAQAPRETHAVFDVQVSGKGPFREQAQETLLLSRRTVDETDDRAGLVARARKAVTPVALPPPPARIKRGAPVSTKAEE